jgi:hypothetical protein
MPAVPNRDQATVDLAKNRGSTAAWEDIAEVSLLIDAMAPQ